MRALLESIKREAGSVLIVGLGISGIECARFFKREGIRSVVAEKISRDEFEKRKKFISEAAELEEQGIEIHFGVDGERVGALLGGVKLAVLSPGVPLESAVCALLKRNGIACVSEFELGIRLLDLPFVAVTGSNGKSTTVTLVHQILSAQGYNSILCGNVGRPIISALNEDLPANKDNSLLVVEASSYQLETCNGLKPKAAALINISENHLERHGDMQRYLNIKAKIFEGQDSDDLAVIFSDNSLTRGAAAKLNGKVAAFGSDADSLEGFEEFAKVNYDRENGEDRVVVGKEIYDTSNGKLLGFHNRLNIAAAILLSRKMGAEPPVIQKAINNFSPLEHRLELVPVKKGFVCINDSKATTVAASIAAVVTVLQAFKGRVTLMLGGLSKAGSWDPLCNCLQKNSERLKAVILFGEDKGLLANYFRNFKLPYQTAQGLKDAVAAAFEYTSPDGILLFSPGCASFDEFNDFEERGREFKRLCLGVS